MSTPDDNTHINVNDDTVIGVDARDDTIITVPIEETVVGSVEIVDDSTVIGDVVPTEQTVITTDDTVIPETKSANWRRVSFMGAGSSSYQSYGIRNA